MRASYIVSIIIRLFAVQWAAQALIAIVAVFGYSATLRHPGEDIIFLWMQLLAAPLSYIALAVGSWLLAGFIAIRVVSDRDPELRIITISALELYTFGLILIGMMSFLSHLAPMMNWIHYLVMNRAGEALMHGKDGLSFYDVTKEVIPCLGGLALAIYSPKIGDRFARASL
jgi:hypothetical protein